MTGPLDIAPTELGAFAGRVEGYGRGSETLTPTDALSVVTDAVPGSQVAAIAVALGARLGRSVSDLGDDLAGIAARTRSAAEAIENTDVANATSIGGS